MAGGATVSERLEYERRILALEVALSDAMRVAEAARTLASIMRRNCANIDDAITVATNNRYHRDDGGGFKIEGFMPAVIAVEKAIAELTGVDGDAEWYWEQLRGGPEPEADNQKRLFPGKQPKSVVERVRDHLISARCFMYDEHWFAQEIDNFLNDESVGSEFLPATATTTDATGWLIEEDAGGVIHWIALAEDAWPRTEVKDRRLGARSSRSFERYLSPVQRVKDANDALRFARKEDAEAFIKLFDRFLLCPVAAEHCWPAP